jgi:predicted SAM-dependent methyltransferase
MRCLNLGCGSRFHPTWTNLDAISSNAAVRACDLNKGIPFPDNSFQVVYHSHVLEHFPKDKAFELMQECRRVLETGGVIRVAVPDLEQIVRMYLKALELSLQGDETWQHNYEWLMIQLYDQAVANNRAENFLSICREARFLTRTSFAAGAERHDVSCRSFEVGR